MKNLKQFGGIPADSEASKRIISELFSPVMNVQLESCVNSSFTYDDNEFLSMMLKEWQTHGHHFLPSLAVNHMTFRGTMNPHNIMEAICAGF